MCKLETDGKMVDQVMGFNYLRVNFNSSGNLVKLKQEYYYFVFWTSLEELEN